MRKRGVQVRVRYLLDAESVKHLVVLGSLQALELVDRQLSVVDGDEVDEFLVVIDIDVHLLNGGRV